MTGGSLNDAAGPDQGAVYVYFGAAGVGVGALPDQVLTVAGGPRMLGFAVAYAGDVNADGYSDVLIGAPDWSDFGGADDGGAYVYLGGSGGLGAAPDATLAGNGGDRFGYDVTGLGDVDADGYSDFAVGAPLDDTGASGAGRAYVYRGGTGATLDATPDLVLDGGAPGGDYGFAIGGGGDFDCDGYADFVVAALAVASVSGTAIGEFLGFHVFLGTDLDDDQLADMLVASPGAEGIVPTGGFVAAFRGNEARELTMAVQSYLGAVGGATFGEAMAAVGRPERRRLGRCGSRCLLGLDVRD